MFLSIEMLFISIYDFREGEYTVNVSIFNNISSAFLTIQIFVVKEPCQPPPVKNMGPSKLQVYFMKILYFNTNKNIVFTNNTNV